MDPKTIALNGGLPLTVNFEPLANGTLPPPAAIKVRQIPVRDYEAALLLVDDEPALVGCLMLIDGKVADRKVALTLAPESFEEVLTIGREVNAKGFFTFCQRRMERAEKQNAAMYGALASLPPETLKAVMERGQAVLNQSRSPILSPGFVSPPVR